LGAIRSIRDGFDGAEDIYKPLDRNFLHKPLGMLNASSRRLFPSRAQHASASRAASQKNRDASKTLIFSMHSMSRKMFLRRVARSRRGTRGVRRPRWPERNMWCRCACEHIRPTENTGFFAAL
jgi:hypothetical protein